MSKHNSQALLPSPIDSKQVGSLGKISVFFCCYFYASMLPQPPLHIIAEDIINSETPTHQETDFVLYMKGVLLLLA